MPYPIEYREGASQVMTGFFLRGENPFAIEHQPLGMNNYGFVYSAVVLPLAALWGNTLLVHRVVSIVFIFLSLVLIAQTLTREGAHPGFALACGLLVAIGLSARAGLGAFPSALGSFLYLAVLLIPFNRAFDHRGMLCGVLLALAAFYTKPYLVLSIAILVSYVYLFVSKRKGLTYGVLFFGLWLASFVLVRYFFKLYLVDTLISNLANIDRSPEHLYEQLHQTMILYAPSVVLALGLTVLVGFSSAAPGSWQPAAFQPRAGVVDGGVIRARVDFMLYAFICGITAFVFLLGQHQGATMTYVYQVVVPPFLLWLFQRLRPQSRFALIAVPLLLANMLLLASTVLNPSFLRQKDSAAWAMLYSYIKPTEHVLNSPVATSRMVELGLQPTDSGQTEYYYLIHPYPEYRFLGPSYGTVKEQGKRYDAQLRQDIEGSRFDKIFLTQGRSFTPRGPVAENYLLLDTLMIEMPQVDQRWSIEVWEPLAER